MSWSRGICPAQSGSLKASSYAGVVLHLQKHWKLLHTHEFRNLERRHVAAELGRIAVSSGLYGANRSRAALSSLFTWAIGEGLADTNPVAGTNKATDEISRDRVLLQDELRLAWQCAGSGDYGAIVRLLILQGSAGRKLAASSGLKLIWMQGFGALARRVPRTRCRMTSRFRRLLFRYCTRYRAGVIVIMFLAQAKDRSRAGRMPRRH